MNIIISILAFILGLRGSFMLRNMKYLHSALKGTLSQFDGKVCGKVVEVNFYTKELSGRNVQLCEPKVEYKLEEQDEICCRRISATTIWNGKKKSFVCGAKNFKVGDKVTVWYKSESTDSLFVQPRRQLTRQFFILFLPGCLYVSIAIWWIYMLIK